MMYWDKAATRILAEIDGIDVGRHDLDNVAYYMVHMSSPTMCQRILDIGQSMVYHGRVAIQNNTNKHQESEQLWLPFDQ